MVKTEIINTVKRGVQSGIIKVFAMQQRSNNHFIKVFTAVLAWIGLASAVTIGAYIIYATLYFLSLGFTGDILYIYIAVSAVCVVFAGTLLLYGGYHALKGSLRKAGIENAVAGFVLFVLFLYFYVYTQWIGKLGVTAYLLFTPALASGVTLLIMVRMGKRAIKIGPQTAESMVTKEKEVTEWKVKCIHCGFLVEVGSDKCPSCGEKPF